MKPRKKIPAHQKQSSALLTFLSVCAIAASTEIVEIEQRSKNYGFAPATEQQSLSQNSINRPIERDSKVLEEIDLEKEWEGILGDESKQELLAYNPPTV